MSYSEGEDAGSTGGAPNGANSEAVAAPDHHSDGHGKHREQHHEGDVGIPDQWLGPPERLRVPSVFSFFLFFSVVYFRRRTLPKKKVKGALLGDLDGIQWSDNVTPDLPGHCHMMFWQWP